MTLPLIQPMLASPPKKEVLSTLVGTHIFDVKLDGIRAIVYWDGSTLKIINRSGRDMTANFPELIDAASYLGKYPVILDGEIVARSGTFQDTAKRDKQSKPADIAKWAAAIPVDFIAFDILHYKTDTRGWPYSERRGLLAAYMVSNGLDDALGQTPWRKTVVGPDLAFVDAVKSLGMEGVIAKRKLSTYRTGRFSDWLKFKNLHSMTMVGIGYEQGTGARAHFGAMFLALLDDDGKPYPGPEGKNWRVGTGFSNSEIAYLKTELDAGRPVLCEVEVLNISRDGALRMPSYKGRRSDLSVTDAKLSQLDTIPRMG